MNKSKESQPVSQQLSTMDSNMVVSNVEGNTIVSRLDGTGQTGYVNFNFSFVNYRVLFYRKRCASLVVMEEIH